MVHIIQDDKIGQDDNEHLQIAFNSLIRIMRNIFYVQFTYIWDGYSYYIYSHI